MPGRSPGAPKLTGPVGSTALYAGAVVVTALCVAICIALPVVTIALSGVLIVLIAVIYWGPVRVGNAFMIIAVFTGPMMRVRPLYPVLTFVSASDLAVLIAVALLAPTMLSRRVRLPKHFLLAWVLLVSGGVLGSLVNHVQIATSVSYIIRFVIAGLFLPLVFFMWRPTIRQVRLGAGAYVAGQIVSTAYGLLEGPRDNHRYFGLTTHALFFGPAGVLATGCGLYLLGRAKTTRQRVVLIISLAICLWSVVMSGSRASLLTAVAVYVIFAITHRSLITIWWLVAGAGAFAISFQQLVASSSQGSAITRLAGNNTTAYADERRTGAFIEALHDFAHHPFTGKGWITILDYHNVPLEMLVGGGILGLIGYLFLIYPMIRRTFDIDIEGGLSLIPIAWLITSLTVPRLWDRIIWIGLALALAGLTAHTEPMAEERAATATPEGSPERSPVLLAP
ncbi:MAG TPA: hypothetical protein VF426_08045 [Marmoricola sp.]